MSERPRPRVDLADLATDLTAADGGDGRWVFDGVASIAPALHREPQGATTITDDDFLARVTDTLRAAVTTWSPFD
jgi:hypothetical protein